MNRNCNNNSINNLFRQKILNVMDFFVYLQPHFNTLRYNIAFNNLINSA